MTTPTQIRELATQILGRYSVATPNARKLAREALKLCEFIEESVYMFGHDEWHKAKAKELGIELEEGK